MGTKYTSQSTSGYNASAPADDGSVSESNKVKWATIKTKLSDVLKTFAEAINSQLVTTLNTSARAISASDSAAATDHWKTIQANTSSITLTLADAATMAAGYIVTVANQSAGDITVALASATDTIDTVTNTTQTIQAKSARTYIVNAAATGYITKEDRLPAASQADQETGTSTIAAVTPGRQHFHQSAAKLWGYVSRAAGTPSLSSPSYNITSVTDDGAGQTIVTIATDFSTAVYSPHAQPISTSDQGAMVHTLAAGTFKVAIFNSDGTTTGTADTTDFAVVAYGDHA